MRAGSGRPTLVGGAGHWQAPSLLVALSLGVRGRILASESYLGHRRSR